MKDEWKDTAFPENYTDKEIFEAFLDFDKQIELLRRARNKAANELIIQCGAGNRIALLIDRQADLLCALHRLLTPGRYDQDFAEKVKLFEEAREKAYDELGCKALNDDVALVLMATANALSALTKLIMECDEL